MSLSTTIAAPADAGSGAAGGPARRGFLRFLRRHALFGALLLAGVALRVVTQLAYRPALLFVDSFNYLANIDSTGIKGSDPLGYTLFLRLVLHIPDLAEVPAVQHALGLGIAVGLYALLVRRGVWTWLAALATAPVLLDAYILQIEQLVMSDALFIVLAVVALIALAWRRRPSVPAIVVAGLALGAAVTVRSVGEPVVIIALAYVVATAGRGVRRRLGRGALLATACALPVAAFALGTTAQYGHPALGASGGRMMYGRAATFADCRGLALPAYERSLCPREPLDARLGVDDYMWGTRSPASTYQPPRGMSKDAVFGDFAMRIFRHQPLGLAKAVTVDFLRGFAPRKADAPGQVSVTRWQFQLGYPQTVGLDPTRIPALVRSGGMYAYADPRFTPFLRGYQLSVGYLPGTAVGVSLLFGVLAFAGVGRARRSPLRGACFLFTAATGGALLAAALVEFSWRYQLPGVVLAPAAGALALTAVFARLPEARTEDAGEDDDDAADAPADTETRPDAA